MQLFILLRARLRGRPGDAVPALSWAGSALPLLPKEEGTMLTSVSSSSSTVSATPHRPPRLSDGIAEEEGRDAEEETAVKESIV